MIKAQKEIKRHGRRNPLPPTGENPKEGNAMKLNDLTRSPELSELCSCVRILAQRKEYETCSDMICQAMGVYPCAPQPHNLLGVVLELNGDHAGAMRHFRAASDLDPTYAPARQNLMTYGTFYSKGTAAYDETDCGERSPQNDKDDCFGLGHLLRRKCS